MSLLLLLRALSVSQKKQTKFVKNPSALSLTVLEKTQAQIISRINGFTYVETEYDYYTGELKEVFRKAYSDGLRSKVNCYGANDVREGVAIMWKEGVDVSITVTLQTRHVSSIRLQAHIRKNVWKPARSISPLLPAVAQAVPSSG